MARKRNTRYAPPGPRKPPPKEQKNYLERAVDYAVNYDPRKKPPGKIAKPPAPKKKTVNRAAKAKPRKG